jgi:RNA polymerase sigma-70 factor (ECF subfamily)
VTAIAIGRPGPSAGDRDGTRADRDGELVEALRRGVPTAAERLVATYGSRAYRLAIAITRNGADAEEVVQDALCSVIRSIETFRAESAFGSWLYRIVANAAYQKLRGRSARPVTISLDEVLPAFHEDGRARPLADWSASLDDHARSTELRLVLAAAIGELPADYRAPLVLRDVEGLATAEVAQALGLTIPNVKSRLHRARLFLRQRLAAHLTPAA